MRTKLFLESTQNQRYFNVEFYRWINVDKSTLNQREYHVDQRRDVVSTYINVESTLSVCGVVSKKILVNKRKAKVDSYEIVCESQNKVEIDVVLSHTEPEINNECKTPTKNTFSSVNQRLDSITKSISNLKAEVIDIKNFIMDELYSLSRSIDRVRTEQIDQTNFMGDVKKIWE